MIIVIWIFLCIILAIAGSKRKIGGAGAFFLSLLLSPLVGFIVVMVSDKTNNIVSSNPLLVVYKDGNDKPFLFKNIGINVPYIQKSITTGTYKVYQKIDEKNYKFLKDFNDIIEAKKYILKLYETPKKSQIE